MENTPANLVSTKLLQYFAIVAEEKNLHRAAERLFMSQPPLSRHMKTLEEDLGITLFTRHTKGLTLTDDGEKVLKAILPLLKMQIETTKRLRALANAQSQPCTIGLSLAFDQGLFSGLEDNLKKLYGKNLRFVRGSSLAMVRAIKKGKVDLALVAMPLETQGLPLYPLGYSESHVAVLPSCWPEASKPHITLQEMNGKPFFWFRRELSPAFFDLAKGFFTHIGFAPEFKEEPLEHDVLLARIAAGEAMGLLPVSFAAIRRQGVSIIPIKEGNMLQIQLAVIANPSKEKLALKLLEITNSSLPQK